MPVVSRIRTAAAAHPRRWASWAAIAVIPLTFLAVSPVLGAGGQLSAGCATWIALAALLELFSMLGFVVVFKLVFGPRTRWRHALAAGVRALGATAVLPLGGLAGPPLGARSTSAKDRSSLTRSAIAFAVITNFPGVIVVGALGLLLWIGLLDGPRGAALTLPPTGLTLAAVTAVGLSRRWSSPDWRRSHGRWFRWGGPPIAAALTVVREGIDEACRLVITGNWKLLGALGYYAFDNAVLWAAFRAYGHAPRLSVVVMGYLVGSLGAALPLPGGIGAVEGGLIGALVLYGAPAGPAVGAVLLYRSISLALPIAFGAGAWAILPAARLRHLGPAVRTRSRPAPTRRSMSASSQRWSDVRRKASGSPRPSKARP